MYRRIVVGYDGSPESDDALALGQMVAATTGGELVVAGVFEFDPWIPFDPRSPGVDADLQAMEADRCRQIEQAAASVRGAAEALASSSPARGLHELAEQRNADLIVVGSSGRARANHVLAGRSVGQRLLHGAPCAVAIAPLDFRERAEPRLRVVAVAFDGSAEAGAALAAAVSLAQANGAELRVLTAVAPAGTLSHGYARVHHEVHSELRRRLEEALASIPESLDADGRLLDGAAADAVADDARNGVDLLCLGSRGYGPLRRVLLGSVSSKLVATAPCPLLVVPRPVVAADEVPR